MSTRETFNKTGNDTRRSNPESIFRVNRSRFQKIDFFEVLIYIIYYIYLNHLYILTWTHMYPNIPANTAKINFLLYENRLQNLYLVTISTFKWFLILFDHNYNFFCWAYILRYLMNTYLWSMQNLHCRSINLFFKEKANRAARYWSI